MLWLIRARYAQFASFREVMMQALVGDEMRESPYLVLRVPPANTHDWWVVCCKRRDACHQHGGFYLGLERDACQSLCLMVQFQQSQHFLMTSIHPGKISKRARAERVRAWGGQVRRGRHLVHDTMLQVQIASSRRMLKRPLKVAFWGEEGVDEGGVQKVRPG